MTGQRITKRAMLSAKPKSSEFTIWDDAVSGFGVRIRPSGNKSYVVVYRAGFGRGSPTRRYTIGKIDKISPELARARAKAILGSVAHGLDPATDKADERCMPAIAELADRFIEEHVVAKRKSQTVKLYRDVLSRVVKPAFGTTKADKLSRQQVAKLHSSLAKTPFQANRVLAIIASMYSFAQRAGVVPEFFNPTRHVEKFKEHRRERFLTGAELERLGQAIREAETAGFAWSINQTQKPSKHLAKREHRFTKVDQSAIAAIRLLLFTGCRLREILHLRWENIDAERGMVFLPDSKSGRKTIVLNAPALTVLNSLPVLGPFVIPSGRPNIPKHDLKRPWAAIIKRAGLEGLRLHDLRHTYASVGAGGGLGLPIIGRLLGHTQPATTARYAHLDSDPLRQATEAIGNRIASALDGKEKATVVQLRRRS